MIEKKTEERIYNPDSQNLILSLTAFLSLALLLLIAFVTYKSVSTSGDNFLSFMIVLFSYGFAGFFLILFFTYRIMSPFIRLVNDMEHIVSGNYNRRLFLRGNDTGIMKSFIERINKILDLLENNHNSNNRLCSVIDTELAEVIELLNQNKLTEERRNNLLDSFREKITLVINEAKR